MWVSWLVILMPIFHSTALLVVAQLQALFCFEIAIGHHVVSGFRQKRGFGRHKESSVPVGWGHAREQTSPQCARRGKQGSSSITAAGSRALCLGITSCSPVLISWRLRMRSGSESGKTEWNVAVRIHAAAAAAARYTVFIYVDPGCHCVFTQASG